MYRLRDRYSGRGHRVLIGAAVAVLTVGGCAPAVQPASAGGGATVPVGDGERTATDADAVNVTEQLLSGRYADVVALFDDRMRAALTEQDLAESTDQALGQFGDLIAVGDPGSVIHDETLVYLVPVSFSRQLAHVRISYDGDGRIAGLYLLR